MSEITPELAERMAAHLKHCSMAHNIRPRDPEAQRRYDEMQAIVAELPPSVDTDLYEARRVIGQSYGSTRFFDSDRLMIGDGPRRVEDITTGKGDDYWETKAVLAGIKRGRELATSS